MTPISAAATRWRNWQGNGQRSCGSQVAGSSPGYAHYCVIALGKCACHQAVQFGTGQGSDLCDWESICGPGGKWRS